MGIILGLVGGLPGRAAAAPASREGGRLFAISRGVRSQLAAMTPGEEISLPGWPVVPGATARVRLVAHQVYAAGAKVYAITKRGRVQVPRSRRMHFWGRAEGDRQIRVMVSLDPGSGEVHGLVLSPQGSFEIEPVVGSQGKRVELRDVRRRLAERGVTPRLGCGFDELAEPFPAEADATSSSITAQALSSLYTATVAVDTDNELMLQKFGDDTTAATNYIADLMAAMNVMYERDLNVRLVQGTTFLRVSTTPDPYTVQDSGGAGPNELNDFRSYWMANYGSISRALAMLLSGRSPSSSSASGIAFLAGLCSTNVGYSFNEVFKIDYLAGDAKLVGHELGHNFGSPHTHCYNPPIDHCYNGESGCYTGVEECPSSGSGTVMSYCHPPFISSCSSTLQFHSRVVSLIDSYTTPAIGVCLFPASAPDTTPPVISDAFAKPRITTPGQSVTITATVVDADSGVASVTATVRDGGGTVVTSLPMTNTTGDLYSTSVDTTAYALDTYAVDIQAVDSSTNANSATSVAATSFELRASFPCNITLSNLTVTGTSLYEACGTITVGPNVLVGATGQLSLRAGTRVSLKNGFSAAPGARVTTGVDPTLNP